MINNEYINKELLLVIISGVLWGTVGIATKFIYQVSDVSALTIGFFRLGIAFPFVYIFSKIYANQRINVNIKDSFLIVFLGILLAAYQVLYFSSIKYIGVSLATVVTLCSAPIIVALQSVFLLKEPFTKKVLFALFFALIGTALTVGLPIHVSTHQNTELGFFLAFCSAFGYGTVTILGRLLSRTYHPVQTTSIAFGVGAFCLFPFASFSSVLIDDNFLKIASLLLYIGLVPSALAYTFFFLGIKRVVASVASILTLIEPLTATILASILFDEMLDTSSYTGITFMIFAIILLCLPNLPSKIISHYL